jgi:hypothetical protein
LRSLFRDIKARRLAEPINGFDKQPGKIRRLRWHVSALRAMLQNDLDAVVAKLTELAD